MIFLILNFNSFSIIFELFMLVFFFIIKLRKMNVLCFVSFIGILVKLENVIWYYVYKKSV